MGFPPDKWGESSEDLFLRLFLFSPEAFTGLEKAKFSFMYRKQNQAPRACNNGSKMRQILPSKATTDNAGRTKSNQGLDNNQSRNNLHN